MHTCPSEGPGCQGPAKRWGAPAVSAGEELLPRLPSPAPSPSPAPEAAGSRTAGPPERGPHLGKGQEAVSMPPPPPTTPHTHLGKGLREFSPPLTLHLSNRTPPAPSNSRLGRAPRGEETMGKGSRASFWQGRRGTWQSSLPAACPSLRKDREYHGVPGGKYGVLPRNVGTTDGGAVLDEGRQGPAQSNRRTPGKAAKLRGSTRREAGDSEDSHPEHSEEKRSGVTGEG